MTEEHVTKRILAFVKKLNSSESEEDLLRAAIAKEWLDEGGNPTSAGKELARSFEDLDSFASLQR